MAQGKKSFIFYTDWIETFKQLPKDKGYDLLMHLLAYVNDEDPESDDVLINAVFANIRNQLKRDLKKFDQIREKRAEAGRKGGKQTQANQANACFVKQTQANQADNDTDTDTVNDIDISVDNSFERFWQMYGKKVDRKKCQAKWLKIAQRDQADIFEHLPNYVAATPDPKYRKNPQTYLNGRVWEDEDLPATKSDYINQSLTNINNGGNEWLDKINIPQRDRGYNR